MNTIQGLPGLKMQQPDMRTEVEKTGDTFSNLLNKTITEIDAQQKNADLAAQELHAGGAKNLHETMILMEQANISLRLLVQMRNKAMEAYQEVMRTQI